MNRRRVRPNWFRIILLFLLILGVVYFNQYIAATLPSPFESTPTPTRAPESFITEAEEYFKQGKLIPAISSYQQAITSNPSDPAVYVALARIQVFAGQYKEAQVNAENSILLNNDSSMAHAVLAWSLAFQDESIKAEDSIKRALELDPNNALAHAYYVEILVKSGSFNVIEQAIEESKVAVALAPDALETHRARGIILEATGNYDEAILEYQQAITINPKISDLYLSLGINLRQKGFNNEAITAFGNADALNPQDPRPDLYISRTYRIGGELGKALQYAKSAVDNDPVDADLRGNLGVMYYLNAYLTEAIKEFGYVVNGGVTDNGQQIKAIPLVPNNLRLAEYYTKYGFALETTNKCSEALLVASTILERIPADEDAVFNANKIIGDCENKIGQTPEPLPTSPETAPAPSETPTPVSSPTP